MFSRSVCRFGGTIVAPFGATRTLFCSSSRASHPSGGSNSGGDQKSSDAASEGQLNKDSSSNVSGTDAAARVPLGGIVSSNGLDSTTSPIAYSVRNGTNSSAVGVHSHAGSSALSHSSGAPTVLSSTYGTEERNDRILAVQEEERRIQRQFKLFEDLIVFEGGALADHESLGIKMIMRDFLFFALYSKKWGYYPKLYRKYRQLMTSGFFDPIPYGSMRNQNDYERYVGKIHESTPSFITPTQMFQPYYGWVIAEYFISVMRAKFDPREVLVVYDVGAGTGALALSMLDYLAEHFPAVYETCEYHVIDQNPMTIPILRQKLVHHYHHVKIHNISILNWRQHDARRCFVLGIELLSTLPHDCILWTRDGTCSEHWYAMQQQDNLSTVHERYYQVTDPVILRYLRYMNWLQEESYHGLKVLSMTDGRENIDPAPSYARTEAELYDSMRVIFTKVLIQHSPFHTAWIPTVSTLMLENITRFMPRHHIFLADWSYVRQGLPGVNGPVVQSKIRIAKDLYLRQAAESLHSNAGMVDICFPTNFDDLQRVYKNICGDYKEVVNMSHPEFWKTYGGDKTNLFMTRSGYNPLLEDFHPFHVFSAHHPQEY